MKTLVLLFMLCIIFPLDAKQKSTQEGVNIYQIYSANQYESDFRNPPVSADITGHTLTVELGSDSVRKSRSNIRKKLHIEEKKTSISGYILEKYYHRL